MIRFEEMTELSRDMLTVESQMVRRTIAMIADETERWCWKAIQHGEGWRVFRRGPRMEGDAIEGFRLVYDLQLLPPGAGAPATGEIFGPWTAEQIAEAKARDAAQAHGYDSGAAA